METVAELLKRVNGNWKMGHITELRELAERCESERDEAQRALEKSRVLNTKAILTSKIEAGVFLLAGIRNAMHTTPYPYQKETLSAIIGPIEEVIERWRKERGE